MPPLGPFPSPGGPHAHHLGKYDPSRGVSPFPHLHIGAKFPTIIWCQKLVSNTLESTSLIYQHNQSTGHSINLDCFSILRQGSTLSYQDHQGGHVYLSQ